jgi:hypothetical protein
MRLPGKNIDSYEWSTIKGWPQSGKGFMDKSDEILDCCWRATLEFSCYAPSFYIETYSPIDRGQPVLDFAVPLLI